MGGGGEVLLTAVLAAGGCWLMFAPPVRRAGDLSDLVGGSGRDAARPAQPLEGDGAGPGRARPERTRVRRRRAVLALAVLALVVGVGPVAGSAVGLVVAVVADRVLDRLEPAEIRRRRAILLDDLPAFADLLAATTRAGVPTARAVAVCAAAVGGPLGLSAGRVATALELGAEPERAWELMTGDEPTAPLAATMIRSGTRGLAPGPGLLACAAQARRARAAAAASRANAVAVSAAAPLGLCFLPAFVLLAVVPTVVGGLANLLGS